HGQVGAQLLVQARLRRRRRRRYRVGFGWCHCRFVSFIVSCWPSDEGGSVGGVRVLRPAAAAAYRARSMTTSASPPVLGVPVRSRRSRSASARAAGLGGRRTLVRCGAAVVNAARAASLRAVTWLS